MSQLFILFNRRERGRKRRREYKRIKGGYIIAINKAICKEQLIKIEWIEGLPLGRASRRPNHLCTPLKLSYTIYIVFFLERIQG